MHPTSIRGKLNPIRRSLGSLALALMITTTLAPLSASAAVNDTSASSLAPPSFPDVAHVANGCHLSTICFLARFTSQFPEERGEPVVINMLNPGGTWKFHTIALLSWRGAIWGRDEYFGVFALGRRCDAMTDFSTLSAVAEKAYLRRAAKVVRQEGMPERPEPPEDMTSGEIFREATLAAQIIPFPSTIFWVRNGRQERPFVFFRPSDRQVAVYEPVHGTCLADCGIRDDAKVVSLVAARLGYHPEGVRRELSLQHETLLANSSR